VNAQGAPTEVKQQAAAAPFTYGSIADQLGAKVVADRGKELAVGGSLTATLSDTSRLTKFGIRGMHEGARVSVFRSAPGKLLVEVDEMAPVPVTKKATLKLDEKGQLSS
jgi:Fe2+ transport system protein FeoA